MKLKTKIQLFSSLFMLILILIINTVIYGLFYKTSANTELESLTDSANDFVQAYVKMYKKNAGDSNDKTGILYDYLLEAYLPSHGMIRIIGDDGKIIGQKMKRSQDEKRKATFVSTEKKSIVKEKDDYVAVVSKPIIWENGQVVTLQMTQRLITLKENMHALFYVLIVSSLLILIPTIIGGRILSSFLLKPVQELIQAMKENQQTKVWRKIEMKNRSKDEIYDMETTFNEMIDNLQDNFQKQELFVSDASHELKTPISIVKSYAQLLRRRGLKDPKLVLEAIEAIESEADRMQKLVEQMLLLAKSELEQEKEKVNVTKLCQAAIKSFKGAYKRDIHFHHDQTIAWVNGNPHQLQQIIYILIDNALKYSENQIDVSLFQYNGRVIFRVKDYGQGISKEDTDHLFDRFYRVDKARSRNTGGTGLGLPIAKTIAEVHQGTLAVDSKLGEGSVFTLELPKA